MDRISAIVVREAVAGTTGEHGRFSWQARPTAMSAIAVGPNLDGNHVRGDDAAPRSPPRTTADRSQCWPMPASTNPNSAQTSTSEGGAVVEHPLRHDGSRRRACEAGARSVWSMVLEPHAVDQTRTGFPCSASFMTERVAPERHRSLEALHDGLFGGAQREGIANASTLAQCRAVTGHEDPVPDLLRP